MSHEDEDDKPTVVLDLNALKKQKLKQEEDLANIGNELEFNVDLEKKSPAPVAKPKGMSVTPVVKKAPSFKVILFDFQSDFFQSSKELFPKGYDYQIAKDLPSLNKFLTSKEFQIVVFNYDVNAKAVNQLSAQIKLKFPTTKTLIMAKAISPEKAKLHANTPSGANGYCQLPLEAAKIEAEFQKIQSAVKKVG